VQLMETLIIIDKWNPDKSSNCLTTEKGKPEASSSADEEASGSGEGNTRKFKFFYWPVWGENGETAQGIGEGNTRVIKQGHWNGGARIHHQGI